MSRKATFVTVFLTVTALALGLELWASFDSSPDTVPWTDLLTEYVPMEAVFAAIGALILWLPIHFWRRYQRRQQTKEN